MILSFTLLALVACGGDGDNIIVERNTQKPSATNQFFCHHQDRTSFNNNWGTDGTACTFLINGKGVIVAVNPSEQEILAAIK